MNIPVIHVIGGGLSGCECALTLAAYGFKVNIYEKRPASGDEVFKTDNLCELVCSNSLGSVKPDTAPGILKAELEELGSFVLRAAKAAAVPGGQALCVDRDKFSQNIKNEISRFPNIEVIRKEILSFDDFGKSDLVVMASGPLTSAKLFESLSEKFKAELYFYDAVSPIIAADSIDMAKAFWQNRYQRGTPDYLNIALNKEEYLRFYEALIGAETVPSHENEKEIFFEGCMPIEELARRGTHTLRFGPMKPKGIIDPQNPDKMPYAVLQLRTENNMHSAFNLVGFQTKMKFGEQKRVFSMIPGLENIKILRYGVIHKNNYIYSPGAVNFDLSLKNSENIYVAGQLLGSEGYTEAIATGKIAALNIILKYLAPAGFAGEYKTLKRSVIGAVKSEEFSAGEVNDKNIVSVLDLIEYEKTMAGSLVKYITKSEVKPKKFVPMNSNFGIIDMKIAGSREGFPEVSKSEICKIKDFFAKIAG